MPASPRLFVQFFSFPPFFLCTSATLCKVGVPQVADTCNSEGGKASYAMEA